MRSRRAMALRVLFGLCFSAILVCQSAPKERLAAAQRLLAQGRFEAAIAELDGCIAEFPADSMLFWPLMPVVPDAVDSNAWFARSALRNNGQPHRAFFNMGARAARPLLK